MTDPILFAFACICLACATFFARDWYRMKRQRDEWREAATLKDYADAWWPDSPAPHIDPMPRDERGRFVKATNSLARPSNGGKNKGEAA